MPGEARRAICKLHRRDVSKLEKIEAPFPRITYDEAVKDFAGTHAKGALENNFEWGGDLGSPDETYISSQFDKPVMVHRYPAKIKAFYMEPDPQRPDLALCVDVLAPEGYGEIIGGSQRMASYDLLVQRIHEHAFPKRLSSGTLTCANSAACRTAVSAWASNAWWPGSAGWSMCGRRFRFRVC